MAPDPLVQFLERRDQASFAHLVARTRDDVLRAAYRVLGDTGAAEDVTQDVFLKCLNPPWKAHEVRSGRALLAGMAVNLAKMRVRGEVRRRAREETAAERRNGDDGGLGRDDIEHVRFAVDNLPEGLKRPVELRYFGGLPLAELARALDVSLTTAKERLAEARLVLRKQLADSRYGAVLLYAAGESNVAPIVDPLPTKAFLAQLESLAAEGVEMSRVASEPVADWKAKYGHRWSAPAAIGALIVVIGGVLWTALSGDDGDADGVVASVPEEVAGDDGDDGSSPDGRKRVTVDADEGEEPAEPGESTVEIKSIAELAAEQESERGSVALSVTVVDEAGNLIREGHAQLDLAGFPSFKVMEKLARYRSLLKPQPLSRANPIVIEDLPDFAHDIELEAGAIVPGYAPAKPRTAVLKKGATATIRVVVHPESETTLTVVDAETGDPVPDAEVLFLTEFDRRDIDEAAPLSEPTPGYGLTDSAGRVVVRRLGEGPHEVEVRAKGYLARVLDDVTLRTERKVELAPMKGAATVVVEVLAPDGSPADGQRVNLKVQGRDTDVVERVDASGRCRFEDVPPGDHVVMLEIEDWAKRIVGGETTSEGTALMEMFEVAAGDEILVRLGSLPAAAPLTVEAVGPDGKPRPGVHVDVYGPLLIDGETDAEGRVIFPDLAAGAYSVHVQLGDDDSTSWTVQRDLEIAAGRPGHLRVIVGDGRVTGRVVRDATGEPVHRAMVFATDEQGRSLMVWTKRDGTFTFGGASAGTIQVSVAAGNDLITEKRGVVVDSGKAPAPIEVRLRVGGSVLVHPKADDTATYQIRFGDDVYEAGRMDEGTHRLGGLPAGRYDVEVVRDGEVVERHSVSIRVEQQTVLDLR